MKKYIILLGLLTQTLALFSQKALVVHAGPSWYLGEKIGITNNTDVYRNGLQGGVAWDVNYYYLGEKYVFDSFKPSAGFIYQGGQYKNTHNEGSDKITMHYIAPQMALFYVKQKYNLSLSTGLGFQFYNNKSFVYDKPRDVSMNKLAYNLSAGGEYLFSSHVGISAKLNWIVASSKSYSVKYHGREWQVNLPELNGGGGDFSQLSMLFGMSYHF